MAFVKEVDIPRIGAGGQGAVLDVGRGPAEGDDIARPEEGSISRRSEDVHDRAIAHADVRSGSRASS